MPPRAYARRRLSAADVAARIPDGAFIYVAGNAATPFALMQALAARDDIRQRIRVAHVLLLHDHLMVGPEAEGRFRHHAFFVGPGDREAVDAGRADYVPMHLHQIPRMLGSGPPLDACLLSVSPPDRHGYMSLGVEVMASLEAARRARRVYVQVNEEMPRVHGDAFLHVEEVDGFVEHTEPLPELAPPPPLPEHDAIARHIEPLVPDGATLQLGIGGVPDAVLRRLADRRDLGIHTEMVGDGLLDAIERGAVNGRRKTLHLGKVVMTFALGTRRLYAWLHDNPLIEARGCDYVNDPYVIAKNDRMVAINGALSVDLTGQVCADSLGTRIWSGFGGQVDFLRGAARSRGGVPIVALPSTARGGAVSRIVPELAPGSGVVTTRADVHWVVTEHGAANLFPLTLQQRARALIRLADPRFRPELEAAARARNLL